MTQSETILVLGAGIVGSAIAYHLTLAPPHEQQVIVVDYAPSHPRSSTGLAPGLVGQFNESEILTRLARESVAEYVTIPDGFESVGGLEIAYSEKGSQRLETRCTKARSCGLPAEMISIDQAVELAPQLIKPSTSGSAAALHFPSDGTANARRITDFYQTEAKTRGAHFVQAEAKEIIISESGKVWGIRIGDSSILADTVILAVGIWTQMLCGPHVDFPIPVIPVAHPYMHGKRENASLPLMPFVRWPEHLVYARAYDFFYGVGSYAHMPVPYKLDANGTARGDWTVGGSSFNTALNQARSLLPVGDDMGPGDKMNGIFSMTPDNLPLVGEVKSVKGLYMAAAVWVTHAAAIAKFLANLVNGREVDHEVREKLYPARFEGGDRRSLEEKALNAYSDIYNTSLENIEKTS